MTDLQHAASDFERNVIRKLKKLEDLLDGLQSVTSGGGGGIAVAAGPDIHIAVAGGVATIGVSFDTVLLVHTGGLPASEFAATGVGLAAALAAASPGETVLFHAVTLTGDFTVPPGVNLLGLDEHASILAGNVAGGNESSLQNLTVSQVGAGSSALVGVSGPADGATFRLRGVSVIVLQAGTGPAYGIEVAGGGDVIFTDCDVHAASAGGAGYGLRVSHGDAYGIGGRLSGSTDRILIG